MSLRQIFILLVMLAIGVFGYLVFISQQADQLSEQISDTKHQLDDTRYDLNKINEKIAKVEKDIEDVQKLKNTKASLQARLDEIKIKTSAYLGEADKIEKNIEKAEAELKESIAKARAEAKGESIPSLVLKSGQALSKPRFQEIKEHEIVFSFANGLKTVGYNDLPQHLVDRFGLTPEVKPLENVETNVEAGENNDVALQKELNVAPLPKDPLTPLSQDQKKQIIATISKLENTLVDWNYKLSAARNQAQKGDKNAVLQYQALEEKVERLKTQIRAYRKRMR